MEPNHNNFAAMPELPSPQEEGAVSAEHNFAAAPESIGTQAPQGSPPPQAVNPSGPGPAPSLQPVSQDTTQPQIHSSTGSLMADDADLIEKEWVNRAKAIVLQTKDDPHNQNREMNKVKADYLKKRYNKDLKISEG